MSDGSIRIRLNTYFSEKNLLLVLTVFDNSFSYVRYVLQHPVLMSGEDPDISKENALKTSLDFLDGFLIEQSYIAGDFITIADFSILASLTQLEAMDYKVSSYK